LNILNENENKEFNYVLQLTKSEIHLFDIELNIIANIPLEYSAVKYLLRKKENFNQLFIYNNNNQLVKFNLNEYGKYIYIKFLS